MNDARMILSIFLTFSLFSTVVIFIPVQLLDGEYYQYDPDVPAYYEGLDIAAYADTTNFTIDDSTFGVAKFDIGMRSYTFELGGVYWIMYVDNFYTRILLGERNYFGIFWISTDYLQFKADLVNRGDVLSSAEMNQDFAGNETWIQYRMYHPIQPEIGCDVNIGFNTSLYSSPSEALTDEALTVYIGMGIDDTLTTVNAWQIIATFFLFSPPNIHPLVNGVIKLVSWSILAVALVLFMGRFIPLIQGGS